MVRFLRFRGFGVRGVPARVPSASVVASVVDTFGHTAVIRGTKWSYGSRRIWAFGTLFVSVLVLVCPDVGPDHDAAEKEKMLPDKQPDLLAPAGANCL
jgi:hypothetical protein